MKYVSGAKNVKLPIINDVLKDNKKDSGHFTTYSSADIRVVFSCYMFMFMNKINIVR